MTNAEENLALVLAKIGDPEAARGITDAVVALIDDRLSRSGVNVLLVEGALPKPHASMVEYAFAMLERSPLSARDAVLGALQRNGVALTPADMLGAIGAITYEERTRRLQKVEADRMKRLAELEAKRAEMSDYTYHANSLLPDHFAASERAAVERALAAHPQKRALVLALAREVVAAAPSKHFPRNEWVSFVNQERA